MAIFDALNSLLGNGDPRAILSQVQPGATPQPQQPQPSPGEAVPVAAAQPGATPGPAPAQQPPVPTLQPVAPQAATGTPPDLGAMYMKLLQDSERRAQFERGATLIAAGFSNDPQSRSNLQQMAAGIGSTKSDPATTVGNLLSLQAKIDDARNRASMRARLPAIAREYGLDLNTVNYLFEAGKLQETLSTMAKPDRQLITTNAGEQQLIDKNKPTSAPITVDATEKKPDWQTVEGPNGEKVLWNKNDPTQQFSLTDRKPTTYQFIDGPNGSKIAINPQNPGQQAQVTAEQPDWVITDDPAEGKKIAVNRRNPTEKIDITSPDFKPTNDLRELWAINVERIAAGQPTISTEQYLKERDQRRNKVHVGEPNKTLYEGFDKQLVEQADSAVASGKAVNVIGTAHDTLDKGVIGGSVASAPVRETRKVIAQAFGISDADSENTDVFQARMKELVLPRIKALGTGNAISNTDREFVEKVVGANEALTPETARKILFIMEKGERNSIAMYNRDINNRVGDDPEARKRVRFVDMPPPTRQYLAAIPSKAIEELKNDPASLTDFNEKWGFGIGEYILRSGR